MHCLIVGDIRSSCQNVNRIPSINKNVNEYSIRWASCMFTSFSTLSLISILYKKLSKITFPLLVSAVTVVPHLTHLICIQVWSCRQGYGPNPGQSTRKSAPETKQTSAFFYNKSGLTFITVKYTMSIQSDYCNCFYCHCPVVSPWLYPIPSADCSERTGIYTEAFN